MKHLLYILLGLTTVVACTPSTNELDQAQSLYKAAITNQDAATQRVALNQLILLDSSNLDYKDSLAMLYMASGNFKAGSRLGQEVYDAGKANQKMKEALALSYQQLNRIDRAEQLIEELWNQTNEYKYQYQKLVIHYNTGNLIAFDTMATQLLSQVNSDSTIAQSTVELTGPVTGANQDVPMKAALFFIIGQHAFDTEQNVQKAVEYLTKSIEIFPTFELPRYALQNIEQMYMAQQRR